MNLRLSQVFIAHVVPDYLQYLNTKGSPAVVIIPSMDITVTTDVWPSFTEKLPNQFMLDLSTLCVMTLMGQPVMVTAFPHLLTLNKLKKDVNTELVVNVNL